jgi:hypothetical protein
VKAIAIGTLVVVVVLGLAAGLGRDLLSRERARLDGTVVAATPGGTDFKAPTARADRIDVALGDGRRVALSGGSVAGPVPGTAVRVSERVTPWGQVWYALTR